MALMLETAFWGLAKVFLVGAGVLYVGLVLMSYRLEGPRSRLRLDFRNPARSAENFLVWLGIKALAAARHGGKAALDVLSEASAEVGEWYIRRRGIDAEVAYRSRYFW
ncbi:MAG: hypothetical protein HYS61_03330 [Acidobacteria bacterium]|nr:hypothetical protein [Acidobacteriota bacterium]